MVWTDRLPLDHVVLQALTAGTTFQRCYRIDREPLTFWPATEMRFGDDLPPTVRDDDGSTVYLLWPENQDETRWSDAADRYAEVAGMYWLPPRGLDTLKTIACNRGLWEDLGNGYVTKKPKKKPAIF